MHLDIRKTAEVALRSLPNTEQRQMLRVLDSLSSSSQAEFSRDPKAHKLVTRSGERLYSYRGSQKLRIVLSIHGDSLVVEDIVDHDRLERMLSHRGRA